MNKLLIIVTTIFSSTIFIGVLIFGVLYTPNDEVSASPLLTQIADDQSKKTDHSERLIIPSLEIDAQIKDVGITKKGNIAAPKSFTDVGWYKYGPLPGEPGTAVIDGHVNNGLGSPAVFSNLKNIKLGDTVYVQTKSDKLLSFTISKIDVYDYNASTENMFIESDDSRLLLITCTGNWIPRIKTHDKRLVVTAALSN